MRVLFWSGTFWPGIGGVEVLAARLLSSLRKRDVEFLVVTPLTKPELPAKDSYEGIPVYRLPFFFGHNRLDHLIEIRQQVARLKQIFAPDLVHLNAAGRSGFFHLLTNNASPAPSLITVHDEKLHDDQPELEAGNETLVGQALRSADWVSCVSTAVLTEICRRVPEIASKASVIHNGLDLPSLSPESLPVQAPRLLCVGRLVPRKGFDVALSAFASVIRRFPSTRMVIAGDGPARPALEHQTAELGLTGFVDFIGWVAPEQIPALVNTATLMIVPSRREPFGLTALEAAQMARPVVATQVGGLSEIVVHGQTGLLVEKENSEAFAEAIVTLLKHPETATQMGHAARSRAIEKFGWDRCVDAYATLYQWLFQEAKNRQGMIKP